MHRPTRRGLLATGGAAGLAAIAGCLAGSPDDRPTADGTPTWPSDPTWEPAAGSPRDANVDAETAVRGLSIPWDLAVAAGDAYVTERSGGLRRFDVATLQTGVDEPASAGTLVLGGQDLPDRTAPGEGGTLGVATHPEYPDPRVAFVYYTATDPLRNRVVRFDLDTDEVTPIVDDIPAAEYHNGGRLAVGPDDHLRVTTGDARDGAAAQVPSSLAGAVLRVTPAGDPAPNNPDYGSAADPRLYTLGHRNPQGLSFTPDGEPLLAEHGPSARDEVSTLRPGHNYGWNVAREGPGGIQYDSYTDHEAFTPPLVNTDETWAPGGTAFYTGDAIPAWRHRLFVAGLRSQTLWAVTLARDGGPSGGRRFDADWLDDRYVATAHAFYDGRFGRLRHVEQGPAGALYLLTSNRDGRAPGEEYPREGDDRIVRIAPAT
jgi:glucose/arabinose dehydrogenase